MGVIEARRRILLSAPHVETTTPAGVANFQTDLISPLQSLKAGFLPVQSGSGDPSPSNVRAITGWSGLTVYKAGKNLFNISALLLNTGTLSGDSLTDTLTNLYNAFGEHTDGIPNTNYKTQIAISVTGYHTGTNINNTRGLTIKVHYDDGSAGNIVYFSNSIGTTATTITSVSAENKQVVGMYIDYGSGSGNIWTISDFIVVPGSTAPSPYSPYTGTTIPVTFPAAAGTVYGGYVDLVRGEVVATMAIDTSLNTKNWLYSANAGKFIVPLSRAYNSGSYSTSVVANIACSHYKPISNVNAYNGAIDKGIGLPYYNGDPMLTIVDKDYTDASVFAATLSGVQLVYQLATPITYPLTPQVIKSLRGTNNIWSDANSDISVEYWKH